MTFSSNNRKKVGIRAPLAVPESTLGPKVRSFTSQNKNGVHVNYKQEDLFNE